MKLLSVIIASGYCSTYKIVAVYCVLEYVDFENHSFSKCLLFLLTRTLVKKRFLSSDLERMVNNLNLLQNQTHLTILITLQYFIIFFTLRVRKKKE